MANNRNNAGSDYSPSDYSRYSSSYNSDSDNRYEQEARAYSRDRYGQKSAQSYSRDRYGQNAQAHANDQSEQDARAYSRDQYSQDARAYSRDRYAQDDQAYSRDRYARDDQTYSEGERAHAGRHAGIAQDAGQSSARQRSGKRDRQDYQFDFQGKHANERSYSRYAYSENLVFTPYGGTYGSQQQPKKKRPTGALAAGIVAIILIVIIAIIGLVVYVQSLPVPITLNGVDVEVGGEKTIAAAMEQEEINPIPGNLVAVDGSIITVGAGDVMEASLNGEPITDTSIKLTKNDVVEIGDGADISEDYDAVEEVVPYEVIDEGYGAIHLMEGTGTDGITEIRTGRISGIVAEVVTVPVSNLVCRNVTPDVGDDKVIALTFDDGPWPTTTAEILDILAEYNVKATFFAVGTCIDEDRAPLVQRADAEGHQICTHTYDHAEGSGQGVNLSYMTPEEQIDEVEMGFACIEDALGHDVTRIMRAPGGNFPESVMVNLHNYVIADIGWNIDTLDWTRPGVESIYSEIMSAWPGAIILMHDGGGDRSQTVEALREALPVLISEGYTFVTISELLEYDLY